MKLDSRFGILLMVVGAAVSVLITPIFWIGAAGTIVGSMILRHGREPKAATAALIAAGGSLVLGFLTGVVVVRWAPRGPLESDVADALGMSLIILAPVIAIATFCAVARHAPLRAIGIFSLCSLGLSILCLALGKALNSEQTANSVGFKIGAVSGPLLVLGVIATVLAAVIAWQHERRYGPGFRGERSPSS